MPSMGISVPQFTVGAMPHGMPTGTSPLGTSPQMPFPHPLSSGFQPIPHPMGMPPNLTIPHSNFYPTHLSSGRPPIITPGMRLGAQSSSFDDAEAGRADISGALSPASLSLLGPSPTNMNMLLGVDGVFGESYCGRYWFKSEAPRAAKG